ncbi:type 1 glutamine amidotransferase [Paucibacter sp. KCTC 42545]|uniref:type 1 glutamine amidotransferase n=1 Tax=Paucibacter sp. KCTC 42545 TaxID=1768242 RepID=UPI000733B2D3|nr:type 1 glutamine amidotransferase [Paucibacter sp. KCTC 42545]ALT79576.1 glutamine amidotransferase [Paucibacter sp. KCTC 42545]
MRPVAILQHEANQGPGYLAEFLHQQGIPCETFRADQDQPLPHRADEFSGLVVLGSNHSVNDEQPWIAREQALVQDAVARDVPVLGHCFGAQLLAKSCGARVTRNAWPNIGWSKLWVTPDARALFGGRAQTTVFNWHYDTFEIPPGARRSLFGTHCINKGFTMGKHVALQCHLEVTEDSVRAWCHESKHELEHVQKSPAVQSEAEILHDLEARTDELHRMARSVYHQWSLGLRRTSVVRAKLYW